MTRRRPIAAKILFLRKFLSVLAAAALCLGLAGLSAVASASPDKPKPGAPQVSGQDVKGARGFQPDSSGGGAAGQTNEESSPTSTSSSGSATASPPSAPDTPRSTDPALKPTDLGALEQDPAVLAELRSKAKNKGSVRVMVTLATEFTALGALSNRDAESQRTSVSALSDEVKAIAVAKGAKVNRTYGGNIPAIALTVTPEAIDKLANSPSVAKIDPDIVFTASDTATTELIGAADAHDRGFHGSGVELAVLDTGVEYEHSSFGGRVVDAACYSTLCPNGGTSQLGGNAGIPCTYAPGDCSHGTHVAGIAAGAGGGVPGVADQSEIFAIQVFHQASCGGSPCARSNFSDITAALNTVFDFRSIGTVSANISIGGGQYFSNCDADFASMKTAIDNLRSVNIATAIASGNNGFTNSVSAPGCISTAITVGATDNADAVAGFSNSSAQVDLYAPGVSVNAAVPGNSYGFKSGTSMATPHVVGSIAMMKAANPGLTVAQEESLLGSSGPLITDSKSGLQRRRINVLQAMGQETITLTNDVVRDLRNPIPYSHRFATLSTVNYWSAVAIRPPAGNDFDLAVYDNADFSGHLASSAAGGDQIDFVAQDSNRRATGDWTYPLAYRFSSSTGRYQIEYANDGTTVGDATYSITMNSPEIIEIRDTFESTGVPTYYRVVPSNSGQNPDLYLMQSTAGNAATYVQGRSSSVASSSGGGAGAPEAFVHTSPASQWNGLVIINRSGSGSYTLYRDTTAPSSSVSINNGDATTASRDVTLSLPASDAETGMMDMQISVDGVFDTEEWVAHSPSGTATLPEGLGSKTVDVRFRNNAGMISTASDTIDLVAATKPPAPSVTGSTGGVTTVEVAFAPNGDGGSPITGYTAQCVGVDGGVTKARNGTTSPITVVGLTGGKNYHCRVRATNALGSGPYSTYGPTVPVTSVPAAPTVLSSTPLSAAVRVGFSPGSNGGSPVTSYLAQCVGVSGGVTKTETGTASPIRVTGLTVGRDYHCRVRATNAIGTGPYSAYGATVTVNAGPPDAPTVTGSTGGPQRVTVDFVPGYEGGTPITGYTAQCVGTSGGVTMTQTGPSSPITVTGLTPAKPYHCRVRATNAAGTGPYSPYGPTVPVT